MNETSRTFDEGSEVASLISCLLSTDAPVTVTIGGEEYTLALVPGEQNRPDSDTAKRSIAGIKKAAGSWKDEDTDAFLAYIYERRSLPPDPAVKL